MTRYVALQKFRGGAPCLRAFSARRVGVFWRASQAKLSRRILRQIAGSYTTRQLLDRVANPILASAGRRCYSRRALRRKRRFQRPFCSLINIGKCRHERFGTVTALDLSLTRFK